MKKWLCLVCGLIYDEATGWPDDGIPAGTRWEDVPDDWVCPECGVGKADFEMLELDDDEADAVATTAGEAEAVARLDAPIVIVGSGCAGYGVAEQIRRHAPDRDIVVLTADDGTNYSKPSLSNALARGKTPEALANETAAEVAQRLGIRVHTACTVTRIDRTNRSVHTSAGEQPYDRLVLALGADPIRLPLDGDGADDVLRVNDLEDYRVFRERLDGARRVAIIGNGLIGCEFANDLAASGVSVEVVGLTDWPMDRQLPEAAGRRLQTALGELGVAWHLGTTVETVARQGNGYRLSLANGEVVEADLVLSAVGLRPRTALAAEAGLKVDRGIVVDRYLRASDPAIHAIGDCVELDGRLLPFILPITHGARALGQTLAGEPVPVDYPLMPVVVKTPAHPVTVLPPAPDAEGQWDVEEDEGGLRALFREADGQLGGFVLTGRLVRERQQWLNQCSVMQSPQLAEAI